jgi:hypothetical protein
MTSNQSRRFATALVSGILALAVAGAQSTPSTDPRQSTSDRIAAARFNQSPLTVTPAVKFALPVSYASAGFFATSVAIADLNGDGNPDIVVANSCQTDSNGESNCSAGGAVGVLLRNGDGTLQSSVSYNSGGAAALSVAIADLNGDGHPDIVVANQCISTSNCSGGVVGVLIGNGDGTFQPAVIYAAGYGAEAVAVGNLNPNGHPAVVVANQCMAAGNCTVGGVSVLLSNGNGTLGAPTTYSSGGQDADAVVIKDLDGDGLLDVVVANQCVTKSSCKTGGIGVLPGNGDGTLRTASTYSSGGYSALSLAVADVNGDGQPDIVVTSLCAQSANCVNGLVGILLGNGNGLFRQAVTYSSSGYGASSIAIGDVNGDGIPDLVVDDICKTISNCSKGGISVLLGSGGGTFQAPLIYSSDGYNATSVALEDVNGDNRPDIVTSNYCLTKSACNGTVAVLLNTTQIKTTTAIVSSTNPSSLNQSVMFTATLTSSPTVPDGELVTFYQGSTVLGTAPIASNVAKFTASFSKASTYTIKAAYAGDAFHKKSSGTVKQVVNQ